MNTKLLSFAFSSLVFSVGLTAGAALMMGSTVTNAGWQAPSAATQTAPAAAPPARPTPPTRDPNTPGYVTAKELPDGANAPSDADGNFIIGPTH